MISRFITLLIVMGVLVWNTSAIVDVASQSIADNSVNLTSPVVLHAELPELRTSHLAQQATVIQMVLVGIGLFVFASIMRTLKKTYRPGKGIQADGIGRYPERVSETGKYPVIRI